MPSRRTRFGDDRVIKCAHTDSFFVNLILSSFSIVTQLNNITGKIKLSDGETIAYCASPGNTPGVIFCGGFASDMSGTKANALDIECRKTGRAFVRFDYRGHGASSGEFADGTIGAWLKDAITVFDSVTDGPQLVVGSSMGGWIMILLALARPSRIKGLVGLAAAPDFTEELLWGRYDEVKRNAIQSQGFVIEPSDYEDSPYIITKQLIEEGRNHLILQKSISLNCPVKLIHGMQDQDVPFEYSIRLAERLQSTDVDVTLVKDGDHRLSAPRDIQRMTGILNALCQEVS